MNETLVLILVGFLLFLMGFAVATMIIEGYYKKQLETFQESVKNQAVTPNITIW